MTEEEEGGREERAMLPLTATPDDRVAEALRDLYAQLPGHVVGGVEYHRIEATKSYLEHMQAIRTMLAPYGLFKEWCLTAGLNYWALHKALSRAYGDTLPDTRATHSKLAIDAASTDSLLQRRLDDADDADAGERMSDEWARRIAAESLRWGWHQIHLRERKGEQAYTESWERFLLLLTHTYATNEDYGPLTPDEANAFVAAQRMFMDVERDEAMAAGLLEIADYGQALDAAIETALTPDRVQRIVFNITRLWQLDAQLSERHFPFR